MSNKKPTQNWDDFRYFLAVVRTGTLSSAAELLDTQHTTVARHIQALEEQLAARLFLKSNTGYELTPAGDRLLAIAEEVESAFLAAKSVANQHDQPLSGTVRIGSPDGLGSTFLAPRMHLLSKKHPQLNIEIIATTRIFSLSKREADIAIGFSRTEHARVVSRRLSDYRLYVFASREYLKSAPRIVTKEDLREHPFIGYVEDFVFFPELDYLHVAGDGISPRLRSTNLLSQVFATLAGGGLCILPTFLTAKFPSLVAVLPEEVSLLRTFYMHIHEDNRKAAHVRAVADFLIGEIEANERLFLSPPGKVAEPFPMQ